MLEEKITIVKRMVENGYYLFNETPERFANRFDLQTLKSFEKAFANYKKKG